MSMEHSVTTSAPKAAAKTAQTTGGQAVAKTPPATPGDFASLLMGLGAQDVPAQDALTDAQAETQTAMDALAQAPADPVLTLPAVAPLPLPEPGQSGEPVAGLGAAAALATTTMGRAGLRALQVGEAGLAEVSSRRVDTTAPADATAEELQPLLRQAVLAQRMAQHRGQAAELAVDAGKEQRGDDAATRLGWRISEQLAPAVGSPVLAAGLGESGLRSFDRRSEKSGPSIGGVGEAGGGWSGVAQTDGTRVDVPVVAPDGGLTTEMRVAEQVSYWIGRGAQNAELEVEGLGEGPVQVSIELQGQEARVEFRADQAQTRQILQDAMPHLKEMLEREGLVLTGLSVGTSGAQSGHGQSSDGRHGQRQGQGAATEVPGVALAAAHRASPLAGRSVDLFV